MKEKIVLIDGHSILNRAFYGLPDLSNSRGLHTNAVYGFLNIMFKILDEEQPQYLAVAFDVKAPTFRHEIYKEYKGTRKAMPEELREQVPVIKEVLHSMGIVTIEKAGLEADDIIGTIAKKSCRDGLNVVVISGDRDLLQLAEDDIKIRIPKTKKGGTEVEDYNTKEVIEKYQITPIQIIDLKALMGDTADNIPGIPGVGEKTATKIIVEYGTIENAYDNVDAIKPNRAKESLREHYELAKLSKTLATINIDAEVEFDRDAAKHGNMYTHEAYLMFKELEFKNLMKKFEISEEEKDSDITDKFERVTSLDRAEAIIQMAFQKQRAGISIIGDKKICGLSVAYDDIICYIEVNDKITDEFIIASVKQMAFACQKLNFINLKSDLKWLELECTENIFDVSIASYLINPLKDAYHYDDIANEFLMMAVPSRQDYIGKALFEDVPPEKTDDLVKCACYIAYVALSSSVVLEEQLEETQMLDLFRKIEMPLIFTLSSMEKYGIKVKREELKEYGDNLVDRIEELKNNIYEQAGEEFNINSPKQLGVILFEKLNMPNAKKTKTGYSTSADILDKLAPEFPVVSDILEYRQLTKLKSTYADGLAAFIAEDERIHGTFNQTITATGRISSTDPNLQNIPIKMELGRLIRKVFIPKDGYVFVDADYSQIELRVLAHMSGDANLIRAYSEAKDVHAATASEVFHVPLDEVTPLMRSNAKAVNFGIVYGISSFGLSKDLSITRKEAAEYIERYFESYPNIKEFLDKLVKDAKDNGYAKTMFNRRRPVPELKSSNFMQRSFGERIAMNSPIQGTAADIIKIAMIDVDNELKKRNMKSRLILQVHDELLIEASADEVNTVREILNEKMMGAANLAVALEIDVHEGNNWYEAK